MGDRPWADLGERLADELDAARRLLEELAVQLCLDPIVFERHPAPLQRFDQLAQVIGEVAGALRSRGPLNDTIDAIRLEAMRGRLAG